MAEFEEIDVTDWQAGGIEQLGTKPKYWLVDPDSTLWLFKEVTSNPRADGSTYDKGDDWSERVAGAVAQELGLPSAQVELAVVRHGAVEVRGVISRMVLGDSQSLIHGNELLAEIGVVGQSPRDRAGYTLGSVQKVLSAVEAPVDRDDLSAWEWFVGYLVLDALIGNTDRHQENWAVIGDGGRRLAPTFDHASCLGFLLDDEERLDRLSPRDRNRDVARFAARGRSKFEGGPHPVEVAVDALGRCSEAARRRWVEAATGLSSIDDLVAMIPTHRASEPARAFAAELFVVNRSRLLSYPVCTLNP